MLEKTQQPKEETPCRFACWPSVCRSPPPPQPPSSRSSPPRRSRLFNYRDLTNWYPALKGHDVGENPGNVVRVEDGLLHIAGDERGCLSTEKAYANYRLIAEFKWGETGYGDREGKALDCGFQIHARGEDGGFRGLWKYAHAAQMIEGGTGDILVLGDGSDSYRVTAPVAEEKQGGSWLFQPDGRMQVVNFRINWWGRDPDWKDEAGLGRARPPNAPGRVEPLRGHCRWRHANARAERRDGQQGLRRAARAGQIQIQIEGGEVWFRRIALEPIAPIHPSANNASSTTATATTSSSMILPHVRRGRLQIYRPSRGKRGHHLFLLAEFRHGHELPDQGCRDDWRERQQAIATKIAPETENKLVTSELGVQNLRALMDATTTLKLVLDRAKEKGMETFISTASTMSTPRGRRKHDSLHVLERTSRVAQRQGGRPSCPSTKRSSARASTPSSARGSSGLNFAIPEVRAQKLAELKDSGRLRRRRHRARLSSASPLLPQAKSNGILKK